MNQRLGSCHKYRYVASVFPLLVNILKYLCTLLSIYAPLVLKQNKTPPQQHKWVPGNPNRQIMDYVSARLNDQGKAGTNLWLHLTRCHLLVMVHLALASHLSGRLLWLLGLLVRNSFSKEVGLGGTGHPSEWSSVGRSGEGEGPGGSAREKRERCLRRVPLRLQPGTCSREGPTAERDPGVPLYGVCS